LLSPQEALELQASPSGEPKSSMESKASVLIISLGTSLSHRIIKILPNLMEKVSSFNLFLNEFSTELNKLQKKG
jgi:hypothetical protein